MSSVNKVMMSLLSKHWCASFRERPDALLAVCGGDRHRRQRGFVFEGAWPDCLVSCLQHVPQAGAATGSDRACQFVNLRGQRGGRDGRHGQQSDLPSTLCVDALPRQHEVKSRSLANCREQTLGSAEARDATDVRLGQAELASVRGDNDMARQHQLQPATQSEAVDRREHRDGGGFDCQHGPMAPFDEYVRAFGVKTIDLVEIGTCAKCPLTGSTDDNAANR
jgi:hypothetical protein